MNSPVNSLFIQIYKCIIFYIALDPSYFIFFKVLEFIFKFNFKLEYNIIKFSKTKYNPELKVFLLLINFK